MFKFIINIILAGSFVIWGNPSLAKEIDIKRLRTGGYTLIIDGKPFLAKGVIYNPTPIGEGYNYSFYSDPNKPWIVDGKLMQEMGVNCVRVYSAGTDLEKVKEFIRDMYERFGIYTVMSDWLGLWDHPCANYSDPIFQEKTKEQILTIVNSLKDEKGLLFWIIGNENNYTFSGKIGFWTSSDIEKIEDPFKKINRKAEIYYTFVNKLAGEIKKVDKVHPIALGNGETSFLDIASGICRNIDVLAIIIYRGKTFGNMFSTISRIFNKPVFLSEFGCDAYNAYKDEEDQDSQTDFLLSQWENLYKETTFSGNEKGNCIGGVVFEWSDEWWKHNEGYTQDWNVHNTEGGWTEGSYYFDNRVKNGLNINEEWFGIVSLSPEKENELNKRIPKKSFYVLKDFFSRLNSISEP